MRVFCLILALIALSLSACSGPRPVLKQNIQRSLVGKEASERDITECQRKADEAGLIHGTSRSGHIGTGITLGLVGGAAVGASTGIVGGGAGVAIGAAVGGGVGAVLGGLAGAFSNVKPNLAYAQHIERCLREKGYEVEEWE